MKILHYINGLTSGGAEKLLTEFLPLMKAKGHNVHLAYSNNKLNVKNYDETLKNAGIKIYNLNVSFYNPLQVILLIRLIRKEQFDIVHAHLFPTQYWLAFASFFICKTKLVKTEHNVFNHRRKYFFLSGIEKLIYSRYLKIIAISEQVKINLANWLKNDSKIILIYNGINLTKIAGINNSKKLINYDFIDKNNFNMLMTARFNGKAKDQNTLIKSIKLLPENYHVYFAGEGVLINNSKVLAKELNIENRVHFLGVRTDVISLMKNVDLNILSSNYEGLSGVTLESLASGKPFIGSDVPGINDVVPGKEFLFPVNDPEMLTQKIKDIAENKNLGLRMAEISANHVKKFDIGLMVDNYLKLYNELTEQKNLTH